MNQNGTEPVNGWAWLNRIPMGQLLSLVAIVAFAATGAWALAGWGDVPQGVSPSPVVQQWSTILIAVLGAAVLHQGIKLFKGGSAEVDQQ